MKEKVSKTILCCYNLFLALGAIYCGIGMISGRLGEYPPEWLDKVPFTDWIYPGIIAIVLFGIGNIVAAFYSLKKESKFLIVSGVMGIILLFSFLLSIVLLGEFYLATGEFIILSIGQLTLTLITFIISWRVHGCLGQK